MVYTSGKEIFEELLKEIAATDAAMFKPPQKLCRHDKEIAKLEDEYLQKTFALYAFFSREQKSLKVKLEYEPDNQQLQKEWNEADSKEDILNELFWYGVRTKYNLWHYEKVGIRKGWLIVEDTHKDSDDMPPFIKKLLES